MASVNDRDIKASALNAKKVSDTAESGKRGRNRAFGGEESVVGSSSGRRKSTIWVDIVLFVVLVGVIVGGVIGYRAVKNAYAPEWDEREIVFVVEMSSVDAEIVPSYWHADAPMYVSTDADAEPIGYLMKGPDIFPSTGASDDGRTYKTVRLTLRGTAAYREGQGYYCGNTPILAGLSGNVRVDGISGTGLVVAVYEVDEYAAAFGSQP